MRGRRRAHDLRFFPFTVHCSAIGYKRSSRVPFQYAMKTFSFIALIAIAFWIALWVYVWFPFGHRYAINSVRKSLEEARTYTGPKRLLYYGGIVFYSFATWPIRSLFVALVLAGVIVSSMGNLTLAKGGSLVPGSIFQAWVT